MCAKGMQNAHFSKRQKLTHSPAHVEKHYTHQRQHQCYRDSGRAICNAIPTTGFTDFCSSATSLK